MSARVQIDRADPLRNDRAFGGFHIWLGPVGLHVFYPDVWRSKFDYARNWR